MAKEFHLQITEIKDNGGYEHIFVGTVGHDVIGRAALYIMDTEAEFRIHLLPAFQNQGYGYELGKYTIEKGLEYLDRIWLGFEEGNESAGKLYEKLGFRYTTHQMEKRAERLWTSHTESEL